MGFSVDYCKPQGGQRNQLQAESHMLVFPLFKVLDIVNKKLELLSTFWDKAG